VLGAITWDCWSLGFGSLPWGFAGGVTDALSCLLPPGTTSARWSEEGIMYERSFTLHTWELEKELNPDVQFPRQKHNLLSQSAKRYCHCHYLVDKNPCVCERCGHIILSARMIVSILIQNWIWVTAITFQCTTYCAQKCLEPVPRKALSAIIGEMFQMWFQSHLL